MSDVWYSPVIYGAPPDPESIHSFAKRMYANLKCDHNGTAWKSGAAATHLKRKMTSKPMCDVKVLSIPDLDEIMPKPTPQTKAKCHAPSAHDSDEVEEVPPVVRKSTQLQPRVVILSINIGDSEYSPDDKTSIDEGSDTEGVRHKCSFDDVEHTPKRLANNPKPIKPPSISPITLLSKGKGKSLNTATDIAVGDQYDTLADGRQVSHGSRNSIDDTGCASKELVISPMPVKSLLACPTTSFSKDNGNSQDITTNKATNVSPHVQLGPDASEANQSHSSTISMTLLPSPDEDGHMEIPQKTQCPALVIRMHPWQPTNAACPSPT
ncbi:hypothetical protein BKA83DRAFT_4500789 [Pisolithus microcarpus]|nr:hypothetical protein BKA83DRAFT_4500789 [Pisolithus microcarpus]